MRDSPREPSDLAVANPGELLRELGELATCLGPALRPAGSDDLLGSLTETAQRLFGAAACSLALLSDDDSELVYTAAAGEGADSVRGMRMPASKGIAGWVVQSGQPIAVSDVSSEPRFAARVAKKTGYVPTTLVVVPVETSDRMLGVISLLDREDVHPDWSRLAHHAQAAGDHAAVLRYAPAAAKAAAAVGAHREAAGLFAHALRFAARLAPEQRVQLLEGYAEEAYLTDLGGDATARLAEALDIHRSRGDLLAEGRTLWQLARHLGRNGSHAEGLAMAQQAVDVLEQIPPDPQLALAYVHLSGAYAIALHPDAISWGAKAISLGEEVGCPQAVYDGLNNIGTIEILHGDLAGVTKLERSRSLAEQAGDSLGVARAHLHLCWMLSLRREWVLLEPYLEPAITYCRDHGHELSLDQLLSFQMQADLARGRWDEATRYADDVLARPEPSSPVSRCGALLVLARLRARCGGPDYGALLDEALRLSKLAMLGFMAPSVAAARAEVAWLEGRLADVLAEDAMPRGIPPGLDPLTAADLISWRWRAGADIGNQDDLPEACRMLLSGDRQGASRWWQERGSPYEAALAMAGSGDVASLRAAMDLLSSLGARSAVGILARELRSLGERGLSRTPRPATSAHPAGLTAREVEVLRLLAAGMRNAEIAAHLVVSPRTVDHHVSAVLAKMNVRSRGEAVAAALRLGLVQT